MTLFDCLSSIRLAGGTVEVLNQDLRVSMPKGKVLNQVQRQVLAQHKTQLLTLLVLAEPKEAVEPVEVEDQEPAERAAIEWESALSQDQAAAVAKAACEDWDRMILAEQLKPILPPVDWLSPSRRQLWQARVAAYQALGMSTDTASVEALCEVIMTGGIE